MKKIILFLCKLWEKPKKFSQFSFSEKLIFPILCFCEFFYRLGFTLVIFLKKRFGGHNCSPTKIISVGNISVGGTGKSVFVKFLAQRLPGRSGAIFLRGYGSENAKKKESVVVHASTRGAYDVTSVGDEAIMFSQVFSSPIVVGKNRVASWRALERFARDHTMQFDYVLLDDAYQNFHLKKDLDIVLLDARHPFGNGHCLPAGPLREKDFSRAHALVLTHADEVEPASLDALKTQLAQNFPAEHIFAGRHKICGVRQCGVKDSPYVDVTNKSLLAVAGIGSFSGFLKSLKAHGVDLCGHIRYPDHHMYTKDDFLHMQRQLAAFGCSGIITTQKDWARLEGLVGQHASLFCVLEITFEFLSQQEEKQFFSHLEEQF